MSTAAPDTAAPAAGHVTAYTHLHIHGAAPVEARQHDNGRAWVAIGAIGCLTIFGTPAELEAVLARALDAVRALGVRA